MYSEDAAWLLANAKQLRRSKNQYTRKSVYLNPYLTATEARAEYEMRCQRRAKRPSGRNNSVNNEPRHDNDNSEPQRIRVIVNSNQDRIGHEQRAHRELSRDQVRIHGSGRNTQRPSETAMDTFYPSADATVPHSQPTATPSGDGIDPSPRPPGDHEGRRLSSDTY